MRKHKILAPESWDANQRNDASEPGLWHLPIYRKVLNSLTWDIWISLSDSNFLMFYLCGLYCKNFYISWFPRCLFRAVSQSYLRCCVLCLSPQFCLLNRTQFPTFRLSIFFSVDRLNCLYELYHLIQGWLWSSPFYKLGNWNLNVKKFILVHWQEYWSGLPFLPPGDLSNPGTEPMTPASPALQVDSLPLSYWGSPRSLAAKNQN